MKFNKKIVAGAVAGALALSAATGFTLAYFTDTEGDLTNTVTFGHVDITLTETSDDIDDETKDVTGTPTVDEPTDETIFSGLDFANVMPGDTYSKIPLVTVEDESQDAYIRVMLTLTVNDPDENNDDNPVIDLDAEELLAMLNIDDALWNVVVEDDTGLPGELVVYAYYDPEAAPLDDGVLTAGDAIEVFDTVTFSTDLDNNNTDDSYSIVIMAEAIQADNFTPMDTDTDDRVDSWGTVTIMEYVAP